MLLIYLFWLILRLSSLWQSFRFTDRYTHFLIFFATFCNLTFSCRGIIKSWVIHFSPQIICTLAVSKHNIAISSYFKKKIRPDNWTTFGHLSRVILKTRCYIYARLITYFRKFVFRQNYQNTRNRLRDFHFHVFSFCLSCLAQ